MSHELRTPFSSFYGLLDILSGTELNSGQREIGMNSCLIINANNVTHHIDSDDRETVL